MAKRMTIMCIASKKTIAKKMTITKFAAVSVRRHPLESPRILNNPRNRISKSTMSRIFHTVRGCVKPRGREDMHRQVLDKGDKPTVSMDYKAFGESEHDDDKIQMVVVKDESTGCVSAHVCEAKGAGDRWVVDRICDDIGLWGHTELIIKGDGEPALIQVQEAIEDKWNHKTVFQKPSAYNPQGNGAAERAVQEIMGEITALKIVLEQRIGIKIPTSSKIMEWIAKLAPVIINRCFVVHDGKTPYSRLMGKHRSKEMVEIGRKSVGEGGQKQKVHKNSSTSATMGRCHMNWGGQTLK